MKSFSISSLAILTILTNGCAGIAADKEDILAYKGYQATNTVDRVVHDFAENPAAFGGVDRESDMHALSVNFGDEGLLMSINQQAIRQARAKGRIGDCEDHYQTVARLLAEHEGYSVMPIYSAPTSDLYGVVIHVSSLVTAPTGEQWVLDNGTILSGLTSEEFKAMGKSQWDASLNIAMSGVATKPVFYSRLKSRQWTSDEAHIIAMLAKAE